MGHSQPAWYVFICRTGAGRRRFPCVPWDAAPLSSLPRLRVILPPTKQCSSEYISRIVSKQSCFSVVFNCSVCTIYPRASKCHCPFALPSSPPALLLFQLHTPRVA